MTSVKLGLKENWLQFTILIIINAFVGGMVGLERSILPRIADVEFHIAARTAILSFIIVFGIVKAITNYFTGALANRLGDTQPACGWVLAPEVWGRDYGREAVTAARGWFDAARPGPSVAMIEDGHRGSERIAAALDYRPLRAVGLAGPPVTLYRRG